MGRYVVNIDEYNVAAGIEGDRSRHFSAGLAASPVGWMGPTLVWPGRRRRRHGADAPRRFRRLASLPSQYDTERATGSLYRDARSSLRWAAGGVQGASGGLS